MQQKNYYIEVPILAATGVRCLSVEASSPEEALLFYRQGEADFVDEDLDAVLGDPHVVSSEDIVEGEDDR
jgi:hypothetical protein